MITKCKNCDHHFEGNFCNNCGQTADTQKINVHFLRRNVQKVLFKYSDAGILYTSRQLFTRPGNTIREYIEGKRVKHFEPFALLVTLATLYGVLYHYFKIDLFAGVSFSPESFKKIDGKMINEWLGTHFALATCLLLPLYTLGSFIAFRKQGYNFVEHLVLNTFLASQRLLLRIATFPVWVFFNGTAYIQPVTRVYIIFDIILMGWGYCQFFNKQTRVKSILLTILSYTVFIICYLVLLVIALILIDIVMARLYPQK
jgi:hypothetical protein